MGETKEELLEYKTQSENQVIYLAKKYALETAMKETGLPEECFDVEVIQTPEQQFLRSTPAIAEARVNKDKYQEYIDKQEKEQEEKKRQEKLEREIKERNEMLSQQERERILSINDIYEYTTVCITDNGTGRLDSKKLALTLNEKSKNGWRLVNSFVDEVGKVSESAGYGGLSSGTNATMCETHLVFERCIKRWR